MKITKPEMEITALDLIGKSSILTDDDLAILQTKKQELRQTFLTSQVYRTRTEMEISVLKDTDHPTPDSKYWQAVREQNVMFTNLVVLSYEYRKNLVEIRKLERLLETQKDELERELIQIEIEKTQFVARNQEREAKDRIREINEWSNIKAELLPQMINGIDKVNDHQLVSYTKQFLMDYITMSNHVSFDEKRNLEGKLKSTIKLAKEKGLFDDVVKTFSSKEQKKIKTALKEL